MACPRHEDPVVLDDQGQERQFFRRHGFYQTLCRGRVPRYLCLTCSKSFSYQSFRMDRYDKKPEINALLLDRMTAGGGHRETAFRVRIRRKNLEAKIRKIVRHVRHLNENTTGQFAEGCRFVFDEMETFENNRRTRPVTIALLVEANTGFIGEVDCAPIRPRGRMTPERRREIARDELRHGKRKDLSIPLIEKAFRCLAEHAKELKLVFLDTDKKKVYPSLAKRILGEDRLVHHTTSSKDPRTTWNRLFRVNLTEAQLRDYAGRLRRQTWLCSKLLCYLRDALQLMRVFRNLIRPLTRKRRHQNITAAMKLGFARRMLGFDDCLGWRQDWGPRSIRPDQDGTVSFAEAA